MADLKALIAQAKERARLQRLEESNRAEGGLATETVMEESPNNSADNPLAHTTDKYGNDIILNDKQMSAVNLAASGKDLVLLGAAGTGKTTTQKAVVNALIQSGRAGILDAGNHKSLKSGTPGIVICAFTRRAVANIARSVSEDMRGNCITIHKLLEFEPVYYEVDDGQGNAKTKMRFEPARNSQNPLPSSIRAVIVEEESMLGTDLYAQLRAALPHDVQFIHLGDIQQLAPVFGPAILGFNMLSLPVIELTEVYRQALESPIIRLLHRILEGKPIPAEEFPSWKFPNQLTIHPWKKRLTDENATTMAGLFFRQASDNGLYDPEEDIILIPYNKALGTIEINKIIANHLARKREAITHEIVAGFNKHYLSVGDKVLFDKQDATVVDIYPNPAFGATSSYVPCSTTLDYWGFDSNSGQLDHSGDEKDLDLILSQVVSSEGEDRVHQASHIVVVKLRDSESERRLQAASELNSLLLGYALTIHKAQGSEWRKVFCVFHNSHAKMIQREMLYTAISRAREECYIICEPDTFEKGIASQKIKGETLAEKAEHFKGKLKDGFKLTGEDE